MPPHVREEICPRLELHTRWLLRSRQLATIVLVASKVRHTCA
jgi:hypothetical protein